jgi:mycoredoxin
MSPDWLTHEALMPKTSALTPTRIQMYATPYCGDTRLARRVLDDMRIDYDFVDFRNNPDATRLVEEINDGFRSSPTIIFPDGSVLVEPSEQELRSHVAQLQAAGLTL